MNALLKRRRFWLLLGTVIGGAVSGHVGPDMLAAAVDLVNLVGAAW